MQPKDLFEWFLQQHGETQEEIVGVLTRAHEVINVRRGDPRYNELGNEELAEQFFKEAILFFVRRDLQVALLPWDASPQYALKVWAQENNIADMPDEVRDALSPGEVRDELSLDEQMAHETAEIVAFLVDNGVTQVVIHTKKTQNGRIVAIMAIEPEEEEGAEPEDQDDELDPWAPLGDEEFDEMVADFEGWDPDDFEVDPDEDDFREFDPDEDD